MMALESEIATTTLKVSVNALEGVSEYFSNGNDAFSQWMKLAGERRLEDLILAKQRLEQENSDLQEKLTKTEKLSPRSGYTQTLQEYLTTPLEEKLELLRNALLNGFYGDANLEEREEFYRLVQEIQPFGLAVLKHLVDACPNFEILLKLRQATNTPFEDTQEQQAVYRKVLGMLSLEEYVAFRSIYYEGCMPDYFPGIPFEKLRSSLDRLHKLGLIYNLLKDPLISEQFEERYFACTPTSIAKPFLDFVSDPRNQLQRIEGKS